MATAATSRQPMAEAAGKLGGKLSMAWYSWYVAREKLELYGSVAATPKSLIDSANPIASADQIAGASIGRISRSAPIRLAPCTRAASSNSCPSPAKPAVTARNENGTERRPSRRTTPNGPMIACVTPGRSRPSRYMTAAGLPHPLPPQRGQPRWQQQHQPHPAGHEPAPGQRGAARQPGDREADSDAEDRGPGAHAHRVGDRDGGRPGERAAQVREREPLRSLAEEPRRDRQDQRRGARDQDREDQQQPEQRPGQPARPRRQPGQRSGPGRAGR